MNQKAKDIFNYIVQNTQKHPGIPLEVPIRCALMSAKETGMTNEETRWVIDILRVEFGVSQKKWAGMVVSVIREIPQELGGTIIQLS